MNHEEIHRIDDLVTIGLKVCAGIGLLLFTGAVFYQAVFGGGLP